MTKVTHPLKGDFDPTAAMWSVVNGPDGEPGLMVGFAPNGMVALRKPGQDDAEMLIYTRAEWEAFVGGVKDNEFDLETFRA